MASTDVQPAMITLELPDSRKPATLSWQHFAVLLIDKYKLGSGACGAVYRVVPKDPARVDEDRCSKIVVLKVETEKFATLYQEAKVYARLKERRGGYQHFLQFYGLVHTNGIPSIALERGQVSLTAWLKARNDDSYYMTKLGCAGQIAQGVEWLHRQDVYHNDLKPDNVLLGVDNRFKLVDFGLATLGAPNPTSGTRAYMAPESLRCRTKAGDAMNLDLSPTSRRSSWVLAMREAVGDGHYGLADVWGVGAILLELFYEHPPCHFFAQPPGSNNFDPILAALDLESENPAWKRNIVVNSHILPLLSMTLARRSARKGITDVRDEVVRLATSKPASPATAPRPLGTSQPTRSRGSPRSQRPLPAAPSTHLKRIPSPNSVVDAYPPPQDSQLAPAPPVVAPSLRPPALQLDVPSNRPGHPHQHDDEELPNVVSVASDGPRNRSIVEGEEDVQSPEESSGGSESGGGVGAEGLVEDPVPEMREEEQEGQEEPEEEPEESSAAISSLAPRQRQGKGKGKDRPILSSIDNLHFPTRPLPLARPSHQPSTSTAVALGVPPSASKSSSSTSPPISSSSSTLSSSFSTWSSDSRDTSVIKYARFQRPELGPGQPKRALLYAKLGQDGGLFAHCPWLLVLTKDQRRAMKYLLKKYKRHASGDDRLRLRILAREVGGGKVNKSQDCQKRRFACALCPYLGGYSRQGFPKGLARQTVCDDHARNGAANGHHEKFGVALIRDVGDGPFVGKRVRTGGDE